MVTLNLTVNAIENQTINATICEGSTYTENGFNVSAAGTYTRTATNANGCEYTITLILTVNPTTYETINQTICEGGSYAYNGVTYTTAGTYTINTTNANGCTHVVTLNLTVNNPTVAIAASAETVCAGTEVTLTASGTDTYLWSTGATTASITITPTETTTYSVTGYDNNGCEATDAITITVNPATSETVNASICEGESYTYNGTVYTTAGTYTINTTNANGKTSNSFNAVFSQYNASWSFVASFHICR